MFSNRKLREETKIGRFFFAEKYHLKSAEYWKNDVFSDEQRFM
jgi:hypothetical protein